MNIKPIRTKKDLTAALSRIDELIDAKQVNCNFTWNSSAGFFFLGKEFFVLSETIKETV